MKPSPNEVAKTVTHVLDARWPTAREEALSWLQAMGIQTISAEEAPRGSDRSIRGLSVQRSQLVVAA